jgi:SAM-dependent methyltransferase
MTGVQPPIRENACRGTHKAAAKLMPRNGACSKILDIPCGEGAFAEAMLKQGREVHAVDCQNILKVQGARFQVADMNQRLPFQDGELDAVVSIEGIEHIERPFDFVRECHRVTRPGGWLILSTPNISALRSRWRWLVTGFHNKCKTPLDESGPDPLHHINVMGFPKLRYMLHTSGYRITGIGTNRSKWISYLYLPLVPIAYLVTRWVFFWEVKGESEKQQNKEILHQMFSPAVLFGETLLLRAQRVD